VLNADRAIYRWWPLLIVAAGVPTLAERPPSIVRGTILTAAGVALLLFFTTDLLEENAWDYVWPALVIAALAIEQIRRARRFKLHVGVFALGIPLLGGVWVLTEYESVASVEALDVPMTPRARGAPAR